jgi:hypothetical protein
MIRASVTWAALALALGDCRACKKDPPPVLFPGFEAGMFSEGSDASADAIGGDAGPPSRVDAERAPGDGRQLVVDGVTLAAPQDSRFLEFLPQDVDGDGDRDLVATLARVGAPATVALFSRDEASFVLARSVQVDAPSAACVPEGLGSYGPRAWVLRYTGCAALGADGGADPATLPPDTVLTEHVALAADGATLTAKARVAELGPPALATQLGLELVYADRDGDGRADVFVRVGAGRPADGPEARAWATVVLLDRGLGFARDTSEPAASVARLLAQARALASQRRRTEAAFAAIDRVRRLRRALCVEAGAPRVRIQGEVGVRCGAMFNGFAEVYARALLTAGELPAAEATQWPDTASEFGVVDGPSFDRDLQRAAGSETGVSARPGPFVGVALDRWTLRASALALDPPEAAARVLVRGPSRTSVDVALLATGPIEAGGVEDLSLRSPDGARVLAGAWQTCAGIQVAVCSASDPACGPSAAEASAPPPGAVLSPLGDLPSPEMSARCLRHEASSAPVSTGGVELQPIGWSREGLVLAWRGRLVRGRGDGSPFVSVGAGPLGAGFAPGSAASPDGRVVALAGADAVYVRDASGRWRGWRPPTLAGRTRQLRDLTVSGDGRTLAARLATQLWLIERP